MRTNRIQMMYGLIEMAMKSRFSGCCTPDWLLRCLG